MCSLFGFLDYQGIVPHRTLKKLTQALANAAEERGTDAAGISYIKDGKVVIYKRPKPAHKIHFHVPDGAAAVMGHTRLATQGSEKQNQNNHPFYGETSDISWSLAHNGCLYNDASLRKEKKLPNTNIETDSYIAVQLIESQEKLDFDSLRYMAEAVNGSFTFSLLDENNSIYIVKGNNPMCLLHFPVLGLYVYASTESILKNALTKIGLHKFASERISTDEGDILCIDCNGNITRSEFNPAPHYYKFYTPHGWYDNYDYYDAYEQTLLDLCHCYGVDEDDVLLLFEYGYTADEVEEMLLDHSLLHAAINDIKFGAGESLYENCYGGAY